MSATWGNKLKITIFGESHGSCIGATIDGIEPGIKIDMDLIEKEMSRRAPGRDNLSTQRKEADKAEIISGFFNGYTTGAPLTVLIHNTDRRSKDYSDIKSIARPGHADYSANKKYNGFNDYRGSGHFSGRITAPLVFAGALAKQILKEKYIYIGSHIKSIGHIEDMKFSENDMNRYTFARLNEQRIPLINEYLRQDMESLILEIKDNGDSLGGVIECAIVGMDAGIGSPFFESVESVLSSIIFSVPAVKGLEFGAGFDICKMKGSQANDQFYYDEDSNLKTRTNHNGGINGGITNSMPIIFRVAIKPTSSIAKMQTSIDMYKKENIDFKIDGRHDPIIVLRVLPVIEAVSAIAVLDMIYSENY